MADTAIEWAESVWNPSTGCDRVSPGCDNCYALTMAARLKAMGQAKYQTDGDPRTSGPGFGLAAHEDALTIPLRWRKPRRVFVNSMSDLFHADVADGFIARVWDVMAQCPQHTFQILTKRHARMRSWVTRWADRAGDGDHDRGLPPMPRGPDAVRATYTSGRAGLFADMLDSMGQPPEGCAYPLYDWMEGQRFWPTVLPNVWLGVSVEDQKWADVRIPALLATPAAVRWISAEPLLGPVHLGDWLLSTLPGDDRIGMQPLHGVPAIDWVVAGGESGPGARPMHPQWARDLRDQCQAAGVPYFFKQWGQWAPYDWTLRDEPVERMAHVGTEPGDVDPCPGYLHPGDELMVRIGKKSAGRDLDGRTWDEHPQEVSSVG